MNSKGFKLKKKKKKKKNRLILMHTNIFNRKTRWEKLDLWRNYGQDNT